MKAYLAAHLVGIANIPHSEIATHINTARQHLNLKESLNDLLDADVLEIFIPTRSEEYSLQIVEFDVDGPNQLKKIDINLDQKALQDSSVILDACIKALQTKALQEDTQK